MLSFSQFIDENSALALKMATDAHAGQTRSGGDPYISHPVRVAAIIAKYKKSHKLDELISAAYLHDTVEDTNLTHDDLVRLFGGLIASLVKELTSDPEKIAQLGKSQYLANKMTHEMTGWALIIKLADRLDNVKDIRTAKSPDWRLKYKIETLFILDYLEKNRVLTGPQSTLAKMIRAKVGELG